MTMPLNPKLRVSKTAQEAFWRIANGRHADSMLDRIRLRKTDAARREAAVLEMLIAYPEVAKKLSAALYDLEWEKAESASWQARALKAEAEAIRRGEI